MDSNPTPRLRAMAAGLLNAAEFALGKEAPALLDKERFELLQLSSFKYSQIVGLEAQLTNKIDGSIKVKLRKENQIILKTNSSMGGLMVLSEIYYKPGWKATINGNPAKIYQTNHILRSVYVPKGENEIIFWYDTSLFNQTRILSRISFLIVLFSMGMLYRKEDQQYA